VRRIYEANGVLAGSIEYDGNVVVIRVRQPPQQLQRGGSLWAKVGPYIYVFNPASQQVLETYPGIAGVRAITRGPGGREVARATLPSANLNPILWRRALNLLGHAVNSGTERPSTIEALVRWGEQYTQFRYNPEFVPEAAGRSPGEDDP
jgi:hypothetical protein